MEKRQLTQEVLYTVAYNGSTCTTFSAKLTSLCTGATHGVTKPPNIPQVLVFQFCIVPFLEDTLPAPYPIHAQCKNRSLFSAQFMTLISVGFIQVCTINFAVFTVRLCCLIIQAKCSVTAAGTSILPA